jgi:hypothetical protein
MLRARCVPRTFSCSWTTPDARWPAKRPGRISVIRPASPEKPESHHDALVDEDQRRDLLRKAEDEVRRVSREHGWDSPQARAERQRQLGLERSTAAELGLAYAQRVDLGVTWDTGAPMPVLLSGPGPRRSALIGRPRQRAVRARSVGKPRVLTVSHGHRRLRWPAFRLHSEKAVAAF